MSVQEKTALGAQWSGTIAPSADDDFAAEFEQNCGFLLGGVLWMIRKAFGTDPIVELVKPLCGDWGVMGAASKGWLEVESGCKNIGENFSALSALPESDWSGGASDNFRVRMSDLGENYASYATGANLMSELTDSLVLVAKETANVIALMISFIGDIAERLIIEASVPVVGWIVGAADVAIHIKAFWQRFNRAMKAIKGIVEAIEKAVMAIQKVIIVMRVLTRVLNAMTVGARTINGAQIPGAVNSAYGGGGVPNGA